MEIAPRPFGDILNEGIALFIRVWRRLLVPAFWAFLLLGGLTIVTLQATGTTEFLQRLLTDPESVEQMSESELVERLIDLSVAAFLGGSLQLLASGFVNLAAHRIVASEYAGVPVTAGAGVATAFKRLPTLLIAGVLALVAILLGTVALIIPGIWLFGVFTMLTPVIALEGLGPIASMRRCFTLVGDRWFQTIGFVILVGLLGSVAVQLVQLLALPVLAVGGIGLGAGLGFVLLMVVQGLVVAAIAAMTTRWYIDLRARREPTLLTTLL